MHIAEKYTSLARDATASGDIVAAENYLQHAEHYNRIIMAAQAQNPNVPGMEGQNGANGGRYNPAEPFQRDFDGGDDDDADDYPPQRPFRERPPAERAPNYNQHQQPQPYITQPAFPQTQPQPQPQPVTPAANGEAPQNPETQAAPLPEVERAPKPEGERGPRRRRRPLGEQAKGYNGRNGSANGSTHPSGTGLNGAAPANGAAPDESAS
jgi:hypothetical protein